MTTEPIGFAAARGNMRRNIAAILVAVLASTVLGLFLLRAHEPKRSGGLMLAGVNLPSATFAEQKIPGKAGVDYFYPDERDVDYFVNNGMNVIRLGFVWERLQPALNGPLDPEGCRLDGAVQAITRRDAVVILDLHNYARYRNQIVSSAAVPEESFANFWGRLASIYRADEHVFFGLMNEPHDIEAGRWQHAVQTAIFRIRETGARNRILVSSSQWDSASRFVADGDVWKRVVDPADNFAFEVHQYVDADNTGTHLECPNTSASVAAIQSVTQWMRENKRLAFLSEFGGSGRKDCLTALSYMLEVMQRRPDVWLGWTYFAGGRGWADSDILSIQPVSNNEKPQMEVLKGYLH